MALYPEGYDPDHVPDGHRARLVRQAVRRFFRRLIGKHDDGRDEDPR